MNYCNAPTNAPTNAHASGVPTPLLTPMRTPASGHANGLATHPHTPIGPVGQFKTGTAHKPEVGRTSSPPTGTVFTGNFCDPEPQPIMRPTVRNSATNVAPSPPLSLRDQSLPAERVSRAGPARPFFPAADTFVTGALAASIRLHLETI